MNLKDTLEKWGIDQECISYYGKDKAKLDLSLINHEKDSKLILVTAINPTPAGEGKTTVNIGLSMALNQLGYKSISALREPSLGPCFGMKGGATGGGLATIHPSDDINLHFTGDFHAITSAHNLLAALLDNHIYHGNQLDIDMNQIVWGRVLDMNDRALRTIEIKDARYQRDTRFDITAASEIMAILALSNDMKDLKKRLSSIIVAYNKKGEAIYASDLEAVEAMTVLLKDALEPNVVLTQEQTPAIVHAGPFANIAHGCNSVIATKMSLSLSDYVVTEAGFGSDLGAEKFMNIKAHVAQLNPNAIVLVATIRALKYQDGVAVKDLERENLSALQHGFQHLAHHVKHLQNYGIPVVVALNQFASDTKAERALLKNMGATAGFEVIETEVFSKGGKGALNLAKTIVDKTKIKRDISYLYDVSDTIEQKIEKIAEKVYGADGVIYSPKALEKLGQINHKLYVCMAKTQYSLSDNKALKNVPKGFKIHVDDIRVANGAGFAIVILGSMMTMPGLSKTPNAVNMTIDEDKKISGLK